MTDQRADFCEIFLLNSSKFHSEVPGSIFMRGMYTSPIKTFYHDVFSDHVMSLKNQVSQVSVTAESSVNHKVK
jgi:hypothetical protein